MTKNKGKKILWILILVIGIIISIMLLFLIYNILTGPVDKNSSKKITIEIKNGMNSAQIANILKKNNLIKSTKVFKLYLKLNKTNFLKATTYEMRQDMSLKEIVEMLEKGNKYNPNEIKITFKEGEWVIDYAKLIANKTKNTYEDVINTMKNEEFLKELINEYWFLTDDILNKEIYYPLEGYLAPNTYNFLNSNVSIEEIINKMLKQTEIELNDYKNIMEKNPHYYITMASIAELEGTNYENKRDIVGVFNNRLKMNMNLGSDVTTYYGLQHPMNSDLTKEQFSTENAYNTRAVSMAGKLPVGPICNPSIESIKATINANANDYLFFVADKNGKIHFTKTNREHEQVIKEIKEKGEWIW